MNKKLLQKVIDELKAEKPSLPYVLGMLETMMEMNDERTVPMGAIIGNGGFGIPNANVTSAPQNLSAAEQAAALADQGFIKGTKPGVVESNIILNQ